ncbi:MAG TPA: hypothetical protein DCZ94_04000 [Lentisphaeria bacterium]|nr:hypothetical protein [Lentisphaeria bacterium]
MNKIEDIKSAINSLPKRDFVRLRQWFSEKDWTAWDKQIEEDSKSGKLDFLVAEAISDKRKGKLRDL